MILRTRTLLSIILTSFSIITVVSSYGKHSGTTQTHNDSETAYQEIVDVLLKLPTTHGYFSSIFIRVLKASPITLSLDLLKSPCDLANRAVIQQWTSGTTSGKHVKEQ